MDRHHHTFIINLDVYNLIMVVCIAITIIRQASPEFILVIEIEFDNIFRHFIIVTLEVFISIILMGFIADIYLRILADIAREFIVYIVKGFI